MPAIFAPEFTSGGCELPRSLVKPVIGAIPKNSSLPRVPVSNLTAELLGGNIYLIRGRAEPGTTIRAGGRESLVATDKEFRIQITAPPGLGEIMIEAMDVQGNSSNYRLALGGGGRGRD